MKSLITQAITWIARVALGVVFIYASWHKLEDPGTFALDIFHYQLAPGWMINPSALVLPWIELFAGIALIIAPRFRQGAAILIFGMLAVFTVAIGIDLARGIDISCGCFSSGGKGQHIGAMKILENVTMIAASMFLVWKERPPPGPKYQL